LHDRSIDSEAADFDFKARFAADPCDQQHPIQTIHFGLTGQLTTFFENLRLARNAGKIVLEAWRFHLE
jgi:hypothetical protein